MNRMIILSITALFSAAALAVEPVAPTTGTQASISNLLIAGPLQSYDAKTGTAVILGQSVPVGAQSLPAVGLTATVFGAINNNGSLSVSSIGTTGDVYVPGGAQIFLSGIVEKTNPLLDQITVGGVTVDLAYALEASDLPMPSVGETLQILGKQPAIGGVVLAEAIHVGIPAIITSADALALEIFAETERSHGGPGDIGITGTGNIHSHD